MCAPDNDTEAHGAMKSIGESLDKLVQLNGESIEIQALRNNIEINVGLLINIANNKLGICFEALRTIKELEQDDKATQEQKLQSIQEVMQRLESNIYNIPPLSRIVKNNQ